MIDRPALVRGGSNHPNRMTVFQRNMRPHLYLPLLGLSAGLIACSGDNNNNNNTMAKDFGTQMGNPDLGMQMGNPDMGQMGNPDMGQMGNPDMGQMGNPDMGQMGNPDMGMQMMATCAQACQHLFDCTNPVCPDFTQPAAECTADCEADPNFQMQTDMIIAATCPDITAQLCPPPGSEFRCLTDCPMGNECPMGEICQDVTNMGNNQCIIDFDPIPGNLPICDAMTMCAMGSVCFQVDAMAMNGLCFTQCVQPTDCPMGQTCADATGQGDFVCINDGSAIPPNAPMCSGSNALPDGLHLLPDAVILDQR